jgi:hypothetical protein
MEQVPTDKKQRMPSSRVLEVTHREPRGSADHDGRGLAGDGSPIRPSNAITASRNYVEGGGAKKQRREPFGRRQRQNSPSGDG